MGDLARTRVLTGWHATVARWLLLGVMLRALLPVGYMPQFGVRSGESAAFVICSEHGLVQAATPESAPRVPAEAARKASDACAFGALAHLFQPATYALSFGILSPDTARVAPFAHLSTPPIDVGPQLGARAPPSYS